MCGCRDVFRIVVVIQVIVMGATMTLGCGDDVSERPEETEEFLDDEELEELIEAGMEVHKGDDPPEGIAEEDGWLMSSVVVAFDENEDLIGNERSPMIFEFSDMDKVVGVITAGYYHPLSEASAQGAGAYISGRNNCFSIYVDVSGVNSDNCAYDSVDIYSGCLENNTIVDFQMGFMMLDHEKFTSDGTCENTVSVGSIRIVENTEPATPVESSLGFGGGF